MAVSTTDFHHRPRMYPLENRHLIEEPIISPIVDVFMLTGIERGGQRGIGAMRLARYHHQIESRHLRMGDQQRLPGKRDLVVVGIAAEDSPDRLQPTTYRLRNTPVDAVPDASLHVETLQFSATRSQCPPGLSMVVTERHVSAGVYGTAAVTGPSTSTERILSPQYR